MLLRDLPPAKLRGRNVVRRKKYSKPVNVVNNSSKVQSITSKTTPEKKAVKIDSTPTPTVNTPLWLKSLIYLNHSSAIVCYATVAATLVMYGMTVYAPKLWSQKHSELQQLQKQERQFTYTEEMLKNRLANSADNDQSGFVKPNPNEQPIFLPDTPTKPIKLNTTTTVQPKVILNSVSPVAY